jgi:hypothetical protein
VTKSEDDKNWPEVDTFQSKNLTASHRQKEVDSDIVSADYRRPDMPSAPLQLGNARFFWPASILILLLGLFLRMPGLTRSLWLDETFSAWFSSKSLHRLWNEVPLYESHPPFYCTLLMGWSALFGTTEVGLRSLSVLASVATILLIAVSGRILRAGPLGDKVSLLAAFFFAINAGNINYAQQARPYALETLTASIAVLGALVLLREMHDHRDPTSGGLRGLLPGLATLMIGTALTLWLHSTAFFIALGLWVGLTACLFLLSSNGWRWHRLLAIILAGIGALLLWSPFLPMFIHQSTSIAGGTFWVTLDPANDFQSAWYLAAGGIQPFPLIGTFALIGLVALWRTEKTTALLFTCVLFLPWASILSLSYLFKPVFIDRLFEWTAPIVVSLAALGIFAGLHQPFARFAAIIAIALFCLMATRNYYATPTEDWRGIIQVMRDNLEPGDLIVGNSSEVSVPFAYYYEDGLKSPDVLFLPETYPAKDVSGTELLGARKIVPDDTKRLNDALKSHSRVWLVERRSDLSDPDGLVIAAISASRKPVRSTQQTGIRVTLFQ